MITPQKRDEILALLATTPLSYREIAALTGVSRGVVGNIAVGIFPTKYKPEPECASIPAAPYRQCEPGLVKAAALHAKSLPYADVEEEEPRLELDSEARRRYVRLRKRIWRVVA